MRLFAPNRPGFKDSDYYQIFESALECSGRYIKHIPENNPDQFIFAVFNDIPQDASISQDFGVIGTNPTIVSLLPHFETRPKTYVEGNTIRPATGSLFEIEGFMHEAKLVTVNHRGSVRIIVSRVDNCEEPRQGFFDEVEALLTCSNGQDCAGI